MKQKLLIWGDSPTAPTGFGEVSRNLFRDLHKEYEVDFVGINYFGLEKYDHTKWHIYPVQRSDGLGIEILKNVTASNNYDKIILFQDIFHISRYLPQLQVGDAQIYTYFPIDGGPLYQGWSHFLENDKIINITYSQYAIDTLKESYPWLDVSKIKYLYHGVAPEYSLLTKNLRHSIRESLGWDDKFIAINVNRYQPRKNISATIRAWSLFANGYKLCKCGNAYPKNLNFCDANRCDKSSIIKEVEGKNDVGLYLHMNSAERINGDREANSLQSLALKAGFTDKDVQSKKLMIPSGNIYKNLKTTAQMNELYNAADINITTTFGEGAGLSLLEASATGTTSIAPKNSAIPEMLGDHGILVDNVPNGITTQAFDNSFRRPNVDTYKFVQALENQYQLWIKNNKEKIINREAIERTKKIFQWKDKREWLHDVLKSS